MKSQPVATKAGRHLQLLYFTSTSLSDDGRDLVAIGETDGQPNLFRVGVATGDVTPLTAHDDGVLRSYVYFNGQPHRGFGKASVSFDSQRGVLYYIHGDDIRALALDGTSRTLARLPGDQVTAFTHVSADGRLLCVPTTDAEAFTEDADWPTPHKGIDARVRRLGLSSWLRVYDTATGECLSVERVPNAWVTHVQFSPRDARQILYNHEWPSDCGIRRIWLWDGTTHRALRSVGDGRRADDWTCHEMWERDGRAVIYHGRYADGRSYIGRVGLDDAAPREIALPGDWTRYGHFTVGPDESVLVTDGYYRAKDGDTSASCPWISRLDVDWSGGTVRWRVLGRSDSSWDSQDSHPHPILDDAGRFVYFTTDRDGRREVHRLPATGDGALADLRLTAGVAEPA